MLAMKETTRNTCIFLMLFCLLTACSPAQQKKSQAHSFVLGEREFLLDGESFQIKAAELHYPRIERNSWEHRIKMCKALGMNTICMYVFWNLHEQQPGVFDFKDNLDISTFVRLCQKHGMWVIVRPGPYVCAEWEMGGLPWWLLREPDIRLRSLDSRFMMPAVNFQRQVARQLEPYMLKNGGNILMVQVENEMGSYARDKAYVAALRDSLKSIGWEGTLLFQCDWASNFEKNALDDLLWTMNFGTSANVLNQFTRLEELRPNSPKMCSEYWSGWFDSWGKGHQTRSADAMLNGLSTMLENNISFSLYMTHGGTTYGHWAGANNSSYVPECTSYDYDAPIDEQGRATEKYMRLRDLLQQYTSEELPDIPAPTPLMGISDIKMTDFTPIFMSQNLPAPRFSQEVHPMEYYGMGYGSLMYSCTIPKAMEEASLVIEDVHDYAMVYVNGQLQGRIYRGNEATARLSLANIPDSARLDIFVEAMGRINYGRLIQDHKGITHDVRLIGQQAGHENILSLKNWEIRLLPVESSFVRSRAFLSGSNAASFYRETLHCNNGTAPGYYRTVFSLKRTADTYLDVSQWGKGLVWINGHCLGRFWQVGPQQTLYVPAAWLKKGKNELIILDLIGPTDASQYDMETSFPGLSGRETPVIDQLHKNLMTDDNIINTDVPRSLSHGNDAGPGAK